MKHFSSLRLMVLLLALFPGASIGAESPPNPGTASITGSLAIEQLTPEQNGRFYSLAGKELPW